MTTLQKELEDVIELLATTRCRDIDDHVMHRLQYLLDRVEGNRYTPPPVFSLAKEGADHATS